LKKNRIDPSFIQLVVITHAHFDHVGGLKKIRDLCRCPVGMHPKDAALVRRGEMVFPPGTSAFGKAASALGRLLGGPLVGYVPVEADLLVSQMMDLRPFGVDGTIIPTPGHTAGSLSVLLSDGACFIGDTATNLFPARQGPVMPPFAEDISQLLNSWKALLERGATWICPGHGKPFDAGRLREEMKRRTIR
jgi:glyoxylase-like metal-dependent hydrolase (beta-lactamase superfamily II)